MRLSIFPSFLITALLVIGCASDYSPRADISSAQTIGLVVPSEASEASEAEDVLHLYNLTVTEDRIKNSAIGAGSGAAVGTAVGIGVAALTGCALTGPWAPMCWIIFGGGGAVLGGGTSAVAGATVDTQEEVQAAPLHVYEVNQILPNIKQELLTSTAIQNRALQIIRKQDTEINFEPALWNGERYVLTDSNELITETNLTLSNLNISLNGKAKEDPYLSLNINMQWDLTKYNPEAKKDEAWDAMTASYKSKKRRLSEWLADGGGLLKAEMDTGIEYTIEKAFSNLPRMAK
jgi:hypothetical protein